MIHGGLSMKGIVIYKSKYGSTQQYAEWISETLGFDLANVDEFDPDLLTEYSIVILGSYIHAGKVILKEWLDKNVKLLITKGVFLFTVSGTSPQSEKLRNIYKVTMPSELIMNNQYFAFGGKMDYKKLDRMDKMVMNMGVLLERSEESKIAMRKGYDHVKKKPIFKLIYAVEQYKKTL